MRHIACGVEHAQRGLSLALQSDSSDQVRVVLDCGKVLGNSALSPVPEPGVSQVSLDLFFNSWIRLSAPRFCFGIWASRSRFPIPA